MRAAETQIVSGAISAQQGPAAPLLTSLSQRLHTISWHGAGVVRLISIAFRILTLLLYLTYYSNLFNAALVAKPYRQTLDRASAELSALIDERTRIDRRIEQLRHLVDGLRAVCGDDESTPGGPKVDLPDEAGMSDAIRQIIAASALPMKAPTIRDALVDEGFDANQYSSMLTVVHNTLNRLERQGEIVKVRFPTGGLWGWVTVRPAKQG